MEETRIEEIILPIEIDQMVAPEIILHPIEKWYTSTLIGFCLPMESLTITSVEKIIVMSERTPNSG